RRLLGLRTPGYSVPFVPKPVRGAVPRLQSGARNRLHGVPTGKTKRMAARGDSGRQHGPSGFQLAGRIDDSAQGPAKTRETFLFRWDVERGRNQMGRLGVNAGVAVERLSRRQDEKSLEHSTQLCATAFALLRTCHPRLATSPLATVPHG